MLRDNQFKQVSEALKNATYSAVEATVFGKNKKLKLSNMLCE